MATARIRTPDEPPSAAWNFEGADYVGFCKWPYQEEFEDKDCRQCTTEDRGPTRPPEVDPWPDLDDEDDPDWKPDAQSSSDEEPLECDSGWETESDSIEPEASSFSGKEDIHYSNDSPGRYPLPDLYTSPDLDRLPHGTWHNGRAYYSGNRKYPQSWPLQTINHSNVLPEHIASPTCQSLQGISGHVLSVAQMKNCRNIRFLVPKPSSWRPDASDQILEGSSSNLFYVSGESNGSNMIESRHFRGWHSFYPSRHGLKEVTTSWEFIGEGCIVLENNEYPASRDCIPTWDPLCPLGAPPPTLPVGLETEEEEEDRWALILFEDPEMEQARNVTKDANRQRREEIIAPYHEKLKALLKDWHSFRRNVEAWIHGKGERRDMNWRRVWLLFSPVTSPLPGIRNRARIWEDCESIMDFVALAREGEDMEERHKELEAKISELIDESSYGMPDTDPDVPSWLQAY
ncbi:hypothetical protein IWW34DRAFT_800301 [Fusarium oxysporum f. sp. albedinis]|nr:hypothetical protein IWW34DRAFT_800301 [Fusarium oxysporum f. sp. albedinis]